MNEPIGFIGLGNMGAPMARRLLHGGFALVAYNRSSPALDALVAEGATAAASPRHLAAACEVVFTMLPDGPDVAAVLHGERGVLAGIRRDAVIVDTSTISPLCARAFATQCAAAGATYLDVPVSGGPEGATAGTLSLMAGGDAAALERVRPLLECMGTHIVYCGESGAGAITKACNQLVVALHIAALSEAIVLAEKAGVAPERMLRVLGGGLAASRVMELRGSAMAAGDTAPRGRATYQHKDLGHVLALARAHDVALPITALVDQLYSALIARGGGELDHTALISVVRTLSGM